MEKLNFPIIREDLLPSRSLSMDDFVRFVQINRPYLFNREVYEDWKKRSVVPVPFRLK